MKKVIKCMKKNLNRMNLFPKILKMQLSRSTDIEDGMREVAKSIQIEKIDSQSLVV